MEAVRKDIRRLQENIKPLIQEFLDKHGKCEININVNTYYANTDEKVKLVNHVNITVNVRS